ncbi:endonuclease/exonuclease/phosphatase family protein [Agarivorans aestuarii]|uniref:Endonuclease/exonuclease/phosphatase family protein n=1 Tax=Agarivorans aestuarii TaxID=1563703 RepID=A0ABU7G3V6_9ALTE|nr:endonuclease/exonuclease/phosphatase family protein [Agarivorans aestuarii]MEE1674083.1 endonuclease/exonuclease/phosphatase family protein [Agarivorans aestuarii]
MLVIRWLFQALMLASLLTVLSPLAVAALPACDNQTLDYQPANLQQIQTLPDTDDFSVLVWNSYKGQNQGWTEQLQQFSQHVDFLLLQEASRERMLAWSEGAQWHQYQAIAFEWLGDGLGVMNLAKFASEESCLALSTEPWIRVPKSALLQLYQWQQQQLLLINMHSINFTLSEQDYLRQLQQLGPWLASYQGAVILAGDFNTWSIGRLAVLEQFITAHQLRTVRFEPDNRTRFFGKALDHVFYRGLRVNQSESIVTDSSDHNALLVHFGFAKR